jgi:hypothetical protein
MTLVPNAISAWSVVEFPVGSPVTVSLQKTLESPDCIHCHGEAVIIRSAVGTTVNLKLLDFNEDPANFKLYAVDETGTATLLGPVARTAQQSFSTPLSKFMLVLSSEDRLTAIASNPNVVLRSSVPQGLAAIPFPQSRLKYVVLVRERPVSTTSNLYNTPLLGIPGFRRGTDTEMKIKLSGAMTGSRANVFIEPRKDGPTTIKMRFHELKDAPAGQVYALWAVSPDNRYVRLGQIVNTGLRNEAQIQTETALQDFGLLITMEDEFSNPTGTVVGTIIK